VFNFDKPETKDFTSGCCATSRLRRAASPSNRGR
jgi:hypothetical protein